MKPKTIILLVVALGCGLGASIMTSRLLADRRKADEPEPTVMVLSARARVSGYSLLKEPEKLFEVREVPVAFAPKHPVSDLAELKDQKLNKTVGEGHVLVKDDLLSKEQSSIIENLLPGQRAVAVKVNPESVAGGFVFPTARVDVMCTMNGNESSAKLILQNMLVMAVDDKDVRNPDQKSILPATVTLAASPEEVGRLSLAAKLGELRLLPRSQGDSTRIAQFEVKPEDLKKPSRDRSKGDETAKAEPSVTAPVLPVLPPVEDKKPEAKAVAAVVPKKPARHTMRIITGASVVKAVFSLGEKKDEDDDDDEAGSPQPKPAAKPQPKPAIKPATKPEAKPAPAVGRPSARVGRTRTGS